MNIITIIIITITLINSITIMITMITISFVNIIIVLLLIARSRGNDDLMIKDNLMISEHMFSKSSK